MSNILLSIISVLLVISGTLFFFYYRDILDEQDGVLHASCVPLNLQIRDISSNSFVVEWQTADECLGFVRYGDTIDSINYLAINGNSNVATKKHSIFVENLKPSKVYYLVVSSDGVKYGLEGAPIVINTQAF